jgi:hypothetical protein
MAKREAVKESDDVMMMKMIVEQLKKMNSLLEESTDCLKKLKERFV